MKKIYIPLLFIVAIGFTLRILQILPLAAKGGLNSFYGKEASGFGIVIFLIVMNIIWLYRRK